MLHEGSLLCGIALRLGRRRIGIGKKIHTFTFEDNTRRVASIKNLARIVLATLCELRSGSCGRPQRDHGRVDFSRPIFRRRTHRRRAGEFVSDHHEHSRRYLGVRAKIVDAHVATVRRCALGAAPTHAICRNNVSVFTRNGPMNAPLSLLYLGMLVLTRTGAVLSFIPFFSGRSMPMRVKAGLALLLAIVLTPLVVQKPHFDPNWVPCALAVINEIFVGCMMGLAIRAVFAAIEFGGQLISTTIGLSRSESLMPFNGEAGSAIGTILFYCGVIIFFNTDMHHEMIRALLFSYSIAYPGDFFHGLRGIDALVRETANVFVLGLRMAAPLIALDFVINLTLSILGKAAPKVNVFMISFALKILAGMLLLGLTIRLILQYMNEGIGRAPQRMLELIAN